MLDGVSGALQRRRTFPFHDYGLIVSVTSWVLAVAAISTVLLRLALKLGISKKTWKFGCDDYFIIVAALCSIGQTIVVSLQGARAIGHHFGTLDTPTIKLYQKTEYASCILYIANLGLARVSVCSLIKQVLPGQWQRNTAYAFAVFSLLWTLSAVLVSAFPCNLPRPWDWYKNNKKCHDVTKFVNYVAISNVVIETALISLPLIVWNIRLTACRRISISAIFASRLLVVIAVITQLVLFNRIKSAFDPTFEYWRTTLCVQIAQNLSLITACLPCFHPFILSILSGATKTEDLVFIYRQNDKFKRYFRDKNFTFDAAGASSNSTTPINQHDSHDNCAPLATYGLFDRSSQNMDVIVPISYDSPIMDEAHLEQQADSEIVFNRIVEIPTRPPRVRSTGHDKDLPPLPKTLSDVGVLPVIDWDTDSSDRNSGSSTHSRRPPSDYIFNREKVISVPEADKAYGGDYRHYPPPSPGRD